MGLGAKRVLTVMSRGRALRRRNSTRATRAALPAVAAPGAGGHTGAMSALPAGPLPDGLFPPGIATWLSREPGASGPLLPAELAGTERFVGTRLAEFRHGRECARRALARLGAPPAPVPIGTRREPAWPAGVTGSISHAGQVAAAAVGHARDWRGIGIDLEAPDPLEPALVARICLPAELHGRGDPGRHARLLFALKECAYKALWPTVQAFVDFHELEVRLADGGQWRVETRCARVPATLAAALQGRWAEQDGLLVAAAVLPAGLPAG